MEYGRYLKEVVQALESDPSFRKKLETAEVDDIKVGMMSLSLLLCLPREYIEIGDFGFEIFL